MPHKDDPAPGSRLFCVLFNKHLRVVVETIMKFQRTYVCVALLVFFLASPFVIPAWGVNRDIIELQTQVQALQDQMTHMQQSFDERMGVMKNLMDQNTDSMNKVAAAITSLQTTLQKEQSDSGSHVDQLSSQIQALNDSLDELKARLAKVSKQLEDMQAAQQNLNAQPAQPATAIAPPQPQAPPPDVLYNNALRDYNGGNNDLAMQEFSDYVKYYPNTDLAGNCYFYLAEIAYRKGDYQSAAKDYDQVLQNFPSGNKAASAELKKGFALIELGQRDEGVAALRHVIARYPKSNEALQARERLHKLGVPTTAPSGRRAG
ncbi:MAG: tetratricopeptide repeat protein [Terriglobales bacterium]